MTSRSWADDVYVPQVVPPCTKFVVPSVGTVCGYLDVEDWKKVLEADAELVYAREQVKKGDALADALNEMVVALQGQVDLLHDGQQILVTRNQKLLDDFNKLDEKYQNERVKPRWGSPLAWSVAAVSTTILATILIIRAVD